jgi:hypothetical protein
MAGAPLTGLFDILIRSMINEMCAPQGRMPSMHTRRDFLGSTGSALAGLVFVGCDLMSAPGASAQPGRREVVVNGKRAKTADVHAHCAVPEALALMNLKLEGPVLRPDLDMASAVELRTAISTTSSASR